MQIAVLSDLHLGKKNKLDQFARNPGAEERLYKLLNYLENQVDNIVLLGDIFETMRRGFNSPKKEVKQILASYPEFAKKIQNKNKYTLIYGNHDVVAKDMFQAPAMFKIKDGSTNILFFHGHQVDNLVLDFWGRNFWKPACWVGGWLEKFGIDITKGGNQRSKEKALNDLWPVGAFEKACVAYGKNMNCDIVVTGHSHHPMKVEIWDSLFLNSGARVAGRQDLLIMDTTSHQYEVYKEFNASSQSQPTECAGGAGE